MGAKRSRGLFGRLPWWLHSRLSPWRRAALVLVAVFESWEVALLWRTGFEDRNGIALVLGFVVLGLLLGFELTEHVVAKRDAEVSREIAVWLLPHEPPSLPGVDVAFSTREAQRVASDYYNVFPRRVNQPSGSVPAVFLVMADVAGLGVEGALLMATFQACLRALADSGLPLDELAAQLNRWSWDRSFEGRHFTMGFFADFHAATGRLWYVSAGHQPPMVRRANGDSQRLELRGFPLGALPDSRYEAGSVVLEPGDALVLFSDGVVQARDRRHETFGEERLEWALRATPGLAANAVLSILRSAVMTFAGSARQMDGISFLVLRRPS